MIYYFTPYSTNKNLGAAYNEYMELLPNDEDWACFLDGDTMFLIPDWGDIIQKTVERYPDTGMFTCYTNRVNNPQQLYRGFFSENGDIRAHRNIAITCREINLYKVTLLSRVISGMMMVIQKKTWKDFRFTDGLLKVDTDISRRLLKAGKPVRLIQGIYLLHYYRMNEGRHSTEHLMGI